MSDSVAACGLKICRLSEAVDAALRPSAAKAAASTDPPEGPAARGRRKGSSLPSREQGAAKRAARDVSPSSSGSSQMREMEEQLWQQGFAHVAGVLQLRCDSAVVYWFIVCWALALLLLCCLDVRGP